MSAPTKPTAPDEAYVWQERLAIFLDGADREPTDQELKMADADVRQFMAANHLKT